MSSEILIIGGGVIGLSIARELHRRGESRITVLERASCASEASGAAAGMLGPQADADEIGEFYQFCSVSRNMYPLLAEELLDETGVNIDLDLSGTLSIALSGADLQGLQHRFAIQKRAGLVVEELSAAQARRSEPFVSTDVRGALYFAGDWQVDNRSLCRALKRYCELSTIALHENSPVDDLILEGASVKGAISGGRVFRADITILAAGAWTPQLMSGTPASLPVNPVKGQMISFHTAKQLFTKVIHSPRGYIVPRRDGRVLVGSTTEHTGFDQSTTESAALSLSSVAREISPSLSSLRTSEHWAGLRPHAPDGLPVIGQFEGLENLFLATAHYRNGILLAPATAKLVAESVLDGIGREYTNQFDPARFRLHAVGGGES